MVSNMRIMREGSSPLIDEDKTDGDVVEVKF